MDLTAEEEESLKELVSVYETGDDVAAFMYRRLFQELSHVTGVDDLNMEIRHFEPGYEFQRQIYDGLAEKGLIETVQFPYQSGSQYRGLTSAGRCYFRDRQKRERARLAEREDDRRYARRTAIIGASVSLVGSLLLNLPTIIGFIGQIIGSLPGD